MQKFSDQFDITKDPISQNLQTNSFNLILALNVVHATADLEATINNLSSLLLPSGLLLLIEYTWLPLWMNMTWGLAEGWWYFSDNHREQQPLIDKDKWCEVFSRCGYNSIRILPRNSSLNYPIPMLGFLAIKNAD